MAVQVVHARCAGLDVHKKTVVACVLVSDPLAPGGRRATTRTFGTMTPQLEQLATWLAAQQVSAVAMEATGAYWKPVRNVLEEYGATTGTWAPDALLVVNAEHAKAVPGRKTDVRDAEWLAELLRHGLLRGSFIPERAQRELRELTRYRTALVRERAAEVNRLQKTLEMANLKLASVLTDITGVSGQRLLAALLDVAEAGVAEAGVAEAGVAEAGVAEAGVAEAGPRPLADVVALAHPRVLKTKRAALEQAVVGRLTPTLVFVVRRQLDHIGQLEDLIAQCGEEVDALTRPFAAELARLGTIPGVGQRTAEGLLAEIGADVARFPSHRHLAAWAGMAPGNRESGGKRRPAPTRKGSPWLKAALVEAAWAASRGKTGYLPAQFRRLAARRGAKRALVAVGHSILVIVYHLLKEGTDYTDLGSTHFDERDRDTVRRRAVARLEALGYHVTLTDDTAPLVPAAA